MGELQERVAPQQIASYAEFWPYYLREHSLAATRACHLASTSVALVLVVVAIATLDWRWLPVALAVGYGPAWLSHIFIQHNRPATFRYPFWSFLSDLRMLALWLGGGLSEEVARRLPGGE